MGLHTSVEILFYQCYWHFCGDCDML